MAAAWDSARAATAAGPESVSGFLEALAQTEAHLAGLRLAVLDQARFMPEATKVLDAVTSSTRHTPTQAKATIRLAADLSERFRLILNALQAGLISPAQAEAITDGLRRLPARLSPAELEQCQTEILSWVDELGPSELRTLASRMAEIIDPDRADADEAKRLAREERAAHRNRFLRLAPDHHGSMRITGQLPLADAALLTAQLDALMPPASKYTATSETPTRDARRVDALVLLTQHAASGGTLPSHGVDRPHVHITLDYDTLVTGLGNVNTARRGRRPALGQRRTSPGLQRRPDPHGARHHLPPPGRGPHPPPVHPRPPRRHRAAGPGMRIPRLHHPTGTVPGAPHHPLVVRRGHLPSQRSSALPTPPPPRRTRPPPIRGIPVAGPPRPRHRPAMVHPTPTHRPRPPTPPAPTPPTPTTQPPSRGTTLPTRPPWLGTGTARPGHPQRPPQARRTQPRQPHRTQCRHLGLPQSMNRARKGLDADARRSRSTPPGSTNGPR